MPIVGFDSSILNRPITELPSIPEGIAPSIFRPTDSGSKGYELVLKAMMGASVKTQDEDKFRSHYEQSLSNTLAKFRIQRKKPIYKAYHFASQNPQTTPDMISCLLSQLEPSIERIDVYCAYYNQPYVSCFGESAGQRMLPIVFIERFQNAFPHVCAWKYLVKYPYETDLVFQIDHFESKITPAWRVLKTSNVQLQVFYSGGECNPLVATADVILRLIELFQYGNVNGRSLLSPIVDHIPPLESKLRFHNLGGKGEDQHHTAPVVNLDINLTECIKRPIYYIIWRPEKERAEMKPIFEWGVFYNGVLAEAIRTKGCVKYFRDEDVIHWDPNQDFVSPFSKNDKHFLSRIKELGHDIPRIFRPTL